MNKNLLILGGGEFGHVVCDIAKSTGDFDKIRFLDDEKENDCVIGKLADFEGYRDDYSYAIPSFGSCTLREKWLNRLKEHYKIPTLIHKCSFVAPTAVCFEGVVVCANATVSVNSTVQEGCIIDSGAVISHDACIGRFSLVHAGAVVISSTRVKEYSVIDYGAVVR